MKLTTKQLKQIIKEELNEEQVEFPLETESECDSLKRLRNAYQSLWEEEPENNYYEHMIGHFEKDAALKKCGWREDLGFKGDPEGEEDFYGSEAGEEELSEMKLTTKLLKKIIKEELSEMKLTTKLLKKIIKEELQKMNESEDERTVLGFKYDDDQIIGIFKDGEELPIFFSLSDANDIGKVDELVEPIRDALYDFDKKVTIKFGEDALTSLKRARTKWEELGDSDHYTDYYS